MQYSRLLLPLGVLAITASFFSVPLYATDGVWIKAPQSGSYDVNWSDPATWENGTIANGVGATATFRSDCTYIACKLDTPITLGYFNFECLGDRTVYSLEDNPWQAIQLETTSGAPSVTVAAGARAEFYFPVGGNQGLEKFGSGYLELDTNNYYTGVTTIHAGSLEAWANNALGAAGTGNETVVLSGGNLTIGPYEDYDVLISEDITISGPGAEWDCGALRLYGAAMFTGSVTLDGDATINQNEYANKGDGEITGNIALPDGADVTFVMEHYNAPYSIDNFTSTVSGDISGTGGILVTSAGSTGKGTLILSGNNTYSGGNTASNTTGISVSADVNLGAASNGVVLNNGKLKITGTSYNSTDRTIEIQSGGGTIDIDDASHSFEVASSLAGTGDLIKGGSGTLLLAGDIGSYSGNIMVAEGTLDVGVKDVLGSLTGVTVKSGATIKFEGAESFGTLSGETGATVDLNGHNIQFGSNTLDAAYRGNIIGSAIVKKYGIKTQTLSGDLTYTGDTEIWQGQFILTGNNEAMTGDILVQNGATLQAARGNAISSSTRINMESGSTFTVLDDESIGSLSGDGTVNLSYFNDNPKELSVGQDNTDSEFAGTIIGDGGKLTKIGTGTLTLSGQSTYTDKTTVAEGTLELNDALAIASSSTIEIQAGGTLDTPAGGVVKSFSGAGTINGYGRAIFAGADNSDFTFEGTLDTVSLTKQGTGTCTIAGDRVRGFDAVVEAGTLRFEKRVSESVGLIAIQSGARVESTNNGIGDKIDVDVAAGATLMLEKDEMIGSLSGAGSVLLPDSEQDPYFPLPLATAGLMVGSGDSSKTTTFSGTISGEGYLAKGGCHTLVLDSANTYTGGTMLMDGCIIANHDQAFGTGDLFFDTGELQINEGVTITNEIDFSYFGTGGTLCGNGTLQNDFVADHFVFIEPGNNPLGDSDSIGQLTIDGDFTQNEESYLRIELAGIAAGDYDVLNITGQATFAGTLCVEFSENFTPTNGNSFDILDWGSIALASEFDYYILPELNEGLYWNTSKLYSTGEIFVTDGTAIPEPATLVLLLALAVFAILRRRGL